METFLFINHNERSCAICYKCVEDLYLKFILKFILICIFRIAYFKKRDIPSEPKSKN